MRVCSVLAAKGGVGKTTLCTTLAVAAVQDGKKAGIFDLDPQASATFWFDTREAETPPVASLVPSRLTHTLKAAKAAGFDLALIDTPPHNRDIAFEAAEASDLIIVPARPAVFDARAVEATLSIIRATGKPTYAVLTMCQPFGREVADTAEALALMGAIVCPVQIGHRIAYSRAQQTGLAAQELDPDGKAADEIKQLYAFICSRLNP
jgi:chromosome partitioning protein